MLKLEPGPVPVGCLAKRGEHDDQNKRQIDTGSDASFDACDPPQRVRGSGDHLRRRDGMAGARGG